jgi:hypothetical protein
MRKQSPTLREDNARELYPTFSEEVKDKASCICHKLRTDIAKAAEKEEKLLKRVRQRFLTCLSRKAQAQREQELYSSNKPCML